jgi:hypothetical protein
MTTPYGAIPPPFQIVSPPQSWAAWFQQHLSLDERDAFFNALTDEEITELSSLWAVWTWA